MKSTTAITLIAASMLTGMVGTIFAEQHIRKSTGWITDPEVAAGEWKIELQTPPCDSVHNMEVIWPKESGQPIAIECNQMPVAER